MGQQKMDIRLSRYNIIIYVYIERDMAKLVHFDALGLGKARNRVDS